MHVIALRKTDLESESLSIEHSPEAGDTMVVELKQHHYDIVELSLRELSKVALIMLSRVREGEGIGWYLFTKAEVREILKTAVSQNRLKLDQLHERVRAEIE